MKGGDRGRTRPTARRHRPGHFARSHLASLGRWLRDLLDLVEACDVPVGFGCRNGVCHNCESGLLAGTVSYSPDPLEPPPEGRILVCCSRPPSELTLDL